MGVNVEGLRGKYGPGDLYVSNKEYAYFVYMKPPTPTYYPPVEEVEIGRKIVKVRVYYVGEYRPKTDGSSGWHKANVGGKER